MRKFLGFRTRSSLSAISGLAFLFCLLSFSPTSGADPSAWTSHESVRNWYDVASSGDGAKLAATVAGGQIYTSTDYGTTWTPRDKKRSYTEIASSSDGNKLVAVAVNSPILTSTDAGKTWKTRETPRTWWAVASSSDGTKLVAVVLGGLIYTSANSGLTWKSRENIRNWDSVASSADGTKLVASVLDGRLYTSTNSGASWTPRESARKWAGLASSANGKRLVAVASGNEPTFISDDSGLTWKSFPVKNGRGVASSSDGKTVVITQYGGHINASTDFGRTWSEITYRFLNWQRIALSSDGSRIVAVMGNGLIYTAKASDVIPIKASLEITKVATGSYVIKVTSNAPYTRITVTAIKSGNPSLTFVATTDANGSAVISVAQDLSGYSYLYQLDKK